MTATASETPARVRPGSTRPRPADDVAGLDDVALLARFLRRSGGDPGALAHRLLQRFGSLGALTTAEIAELARIPGADADVCLELKMLRARGEARKGERRPPACHHILDRPAGLCADGHGAPPPRAVSGPLSRSPQQSDRG